jgi:phosphonate transport system substrate-binding protein
MALAFILAIFCLQPSRVQAQPPERLLIGLIPEMNIFKQKQRFHLLGEYLTNKTGVPVEFTILTRYGNIIDNFTSEKLDGAFFGSFTGALAIRKLGVVPLARPVNLDGSSTYHGLLLVRRDSGIATVADMRGKRMAYVDRATTAGYIFPLAYLREHGVNGENGFFRETFFTGSHDAAIIAVLDGKADIAAAKHSVYDRVAKENPRVAKELTIIDKSASVPSNGLCVRADLPGELQKKLRKALLDLENDPAGKGVLAEFGARRFIETTKEDYRPMFAMAIQAGIDVKTYSYRNE